VNCDRVLWIARLVLLLVVLPAWTGCGHGRPRRVPVSGQVLIDGKPVACGFVQFMPKGARASSGKIGPDGRFTLSCFEEGDGAVEGTHVVTVTAFEEMGPKAQRWHAPKKYADPATSGLTQTIDGPADALKVELTWSGAKPFVERLDGGE
jgi:hypothetical protein